MISGMIQGGLHISGSGNRPGSHAPFQRGRQCKWLLALMLSVAWLLAAATAQSLAQAPAAKGDLPISLQPAMGDAAKPDTDGKSADVGAPDEAMPSTLAPQAPEAVPAPDPASRMELPTAPLPAPGDGGMADGQAQQAAGASPARPAQTAEDAGGAQMAVPASSPAANVQNGTAAATTNSRPAATPPPIVEMLPHFLSAGILVGAIMAMMAALVLSGWGGWSGMRGGAMLFAAGAMLFVLAYTGALSIVPQLRLATAELVRLAALAEAMMLAGAGWWLTGWLGMPDGRAGRAALMVTAGLAMALVVLSPFFAETLLPFTRVAMLLAAVGGLAALLHPALAGRARNAAAHVALGGLVLWSVLGVLLAWNLFTITSANAVLLTAAGVSLLAVMMLAAAMREGVREPANAGLPLALAGAEALPVRYDPRRATLRLPAALAEKLRMPPEVLDGMEHFLTIVHPEDRPLLQAALRAASLDEPVEMELRLADGAGVWRQFLLRARVLGGGGNAAHVVHGLLLENASLPTSVASEASASEDGAAPLHDPLTGLPGQALLLDRLDSALARARHGKGLPCMLIVDVDRFRTILDTLGIAAGDLLLIETARRLQALLRDGDTLARLPADQFGLIIDAEAHGTPLSFIQRLRAALAEPMDLDGRETPVSVSIGVVDLVAAMMLSPREIIRAAELALFEARRDGPGHEAFYTPDMHGEHARLAKLEQDLRRALKMGELEVHYQPVAWLNGRLLAGFEALLRWRHPQRGLIGPEEFLGLAEEIGLMREIGQLVLRESVRQLGIWQRAFRTDYPFYIAVNVASSDLLDAALAQEIGELLARENADPAGLKLEVTEHLLLQDPAMARTTLRQLAELGVGVFCDDFGTGHSSLSRLKALPFDALKIDRGFLADDSPASRGIIAAVVELAHGLSMRVVAEGVEEPWQLQMLEQLGCDMAQGFLLARPLDSASILQAMTEARRVAPFAGRLAALSHILLNDAVAPPMPGKAGPEAMPLARVLQRKRQNGKTASAAEAGSQRKAPRNQANGAGHADNAENTSGQDGEASDKDSNSKSAAG